MIRAYIALGAAAAFLTSVAGAYITGRIHGHERGRVAQMEDTIEAYRKRQEIDDEVGGADDYSVCVALGGLPDECKQLRGMDTATTD